MLVTILFAPVMFYALMQVIPVTAGQIVACVWRPALAALSMAVAVAISGTQAIPLLVSRLFCNVGLGATVFASVLLALWVLTGRPAGAEQILVRQARTALNRLFAVTVRPIR
jgi:lipopolysaccharide exporter